MVPHDTPSATTTFLFTDIEGSTRLWEQEPVRMHEALAAHDGISRRVVRENRGELVKMTGDGVHAAFANPVDALRAAVALQLALADAEATGGIALRVRCGLHAGSDSRRGHDFYGTAVNRAARVMSAAHGGQILLSNAVAGLVRPSLPDGFALREIGAVRLRDLARPEIVWQVLHPRLRQDFPALRSLAATPNNLPQPLTSFVGRERDVAEARRQLATTRLLTLLGIGGLGKSRLSLELAREVLDEYADGVWFVELAPVADPQLVPQAVAMALGVKEQAGQSALQALLLFVRECRLLLVLDNCEHLAHACAELARALLEAGAGVAILATSRERLNIRGERTYRLPPLAIPAPNQSVTPDTLAAYAAVHLFVDRAQAVQPGFAPTRENAEKIADICQRLDGIPLALELAAARLGTMSVDAIASRLSDRFRLLRQGDRTALPRQQTLRALIDWSYDLLDDAERALFQALSVFAGGFTLDAAEAVGAAATGEDVTETLSRLVDKSLVIHDASGDRYAMLETVRQYAEGLLTAAAYATRARHLDYYVALAEAARAELTGATQGAALVRLDSELENILAAHRHCDNADGGAALDLRLVSSLMLYWIHRGKYELGRRVTVEALARPAAQAPDLDRCRALFRAGQLALLSGGYDEAGRYLRESLEIARALDVPGAASAVLAPLAVAAIRQGRLDTAREYLVESRALAEKLGDARNLAVALNETGQLERIEGDLVRAQANFQAALALAQALNDRESVAAALLNLAMVDLSSNALASAARMLGEVHGIVDEVGSRHTAQALFDVAAVLAAMRMQWDSAARLFLAAKSMAAEIGLHVHPADEAFLAPVLSETRVRVGATAWQDAAARPAAFADALREVARIVAEAR